MILKIGVSLGFSVTLCNTKMLLSQSITNITAQLYTREITAADTCSRSNDRSRSIIPTMTKFCTMTGWAAISRILLSVGVSYTITRWPTWLIAMCWICVGIA